MYLFHIKDKLIKQQQHDMEFMETSEKIRVPEMRFKPTTLRALVGCSIHGATRDSMVSKSQFVGLDWNRITRQVTASNRTYAVLSGIF